MRRQPSRPQRRRLGVRQIPPIASAEALAIAYREMIDGWMRDVDRELSGWDANVRRDSWIDDKIKHLEEALKKSTGGVEPKIDLVAHRVSQQSNDFFYRTLPRVSLKQFIPRKAIEGFRKENTDKIKSLTETQIKELRTILSEAEKKGDRVETVRKRIQERFGVSKSKASLLARDQVLKMNASIAKERQTQAGITHYQWSTSGDERVRDGHKDLDGEIISWDDPPDTGDGAKNHPGEDYQCRCVPIPILPEDSPQEELAPAEPGEEPAGAEPEPEPEPPPSAFDPLAPEPEPEEPEALDFDATGSSLRIEDGWISEERAREIIRQSIGPENKEFLERNPIDVVIRPKSSYAGASPRSEAMYFPQENKIEMYRSSLDEPFRPGESWRAGDYTTYEGAERAVMTHEYGHHVHLYDARENTSAFGVVDDMIRAQYQASSVDRLASISQYGSVNHLEYWAESYTAYQLAPDSLLRHDPGGYAMVETVLRLRGIQPKERPA